MNRYSRIFKYLGQDKGQIFLYFLFIILSIVFSIVSLGLLMPFLELIFNGDNSTMSSLMKETGNPVVQRIRNFLIESIEKNGSGIQGKLTTLALICGFIIISIFLKNVFLYLSNYILNPLKNRLVMRMRNDIFDKILHLPIGYFTEQKKGDLISRITNDVGEVEGSVVGTLEGFIRDPLTILLTLTALIYISPQLTLFVLLFVPVIGFVIGRISKSLKSHSGDVAQHASESLSVLDETLSGLRVIKAFNVEDRIRHKFFSINQQLLSSRNKISHRRDLASPTSEFMIIILFCGILYFGGRLVLSNNIALEASAFIGYLGLFFNIISPAKTLSTSFSNMRRGIAAIDRIEEVLNTTNTVDDNPNGKKLAAFSKGIELRNVTFGYEGVEILKNINLNIEKGKTIALVGSSGAGKSTLADLVPRFHDVTGGELLIDGVNIKDYSLHSIREQISIVTQEPILFNDSIANNIKLGKPDASEAEVTAAATIANAHQYISKKEAGYQTNIGDRGSKLSGGERQRLTIARAVLKNPPILILDEATSSLDTESERLVQDAINNMMQNRTSIVIAHRLSTIRHADEIVVLQRGEIVERGTHNQLMELQGYYYKLVQMQEVK